MTKQEKRKMLQLYADGLSLPNMALELGVSLATLKRWIAYTRREHGYPAHRKGSTHRKLNQPDPDVEESPWNVYRGLEYIKKKWTADEVSE